ncbi:PREDICTED: uncharacterized protein LOC107351957 isoform X2 [Acropora digitifera]|uniref:uncharacterized protein LOC107351957 isoform X2 n=1 Tax=Acropora digitifera TaxID=70779 RepID=UPI00077AE92F|nr:PREDICTED: uncharacterized protein LOC107351957 isoform X2 [Acropora digitifera]
MYSRAVRFTWFGCNLCGSHLESQVVHTKMARIRLPLSCILLVLLLRDSTEVVLLKGNDFELIDTQKIEAGKAQLDEFRMNAEKSDCWKEALQGIETRCRKLGVVEQSYLAIDFTNCHASQSGRKTYPCLRVTHSIKECTGKMDETTFMAYTTFFIHTANICFYVKSELWQHKTENTISKLSKISEDVASQLEDSARKQLQMLQKQNTSLENQQKIISQEMQLSETLRNSTLNARKAFEDMKQNAVEQRALFTETFDSVFKSLEKVRALQSMLLGEFISLQSVAFYVAAMCSCYFLTSIPRTSGARLPVFIGFTVLIILEWLVTIWSDKQSVDSTQQIDDVRERQKEIKDLIAKTNEESQQKSSTKQSIAPPETNTERKSKEIRDFNYSNL